MADRLVCRLWLRDRRDLNDFELKVTANEHGLLYYDLRDERGQSYALSYVDLNPHELPASVREAGAGNAEVFGWLQDKILPSQIQRTWLEPEAVVSGSARSAGLSRIRQEALGHYHDIAQFNEACANEEHTDTGAVWELLDTLSGWLEKVGKDG